ncbi:L,D-transpeptidase [Sulfurimonas sp.]|uniref:L,D-transpeptidase family protein n=1 Tax=Sulfurimonas sp. TaxID=2022749 RepID=UPI003569B8A7
MLKSFLIIINFHIFAFASQIVLVVADNTNTNKAKLQCFEDNKKVGKTIDVNIGKNGLGLGVSKLTPNFDIKIYKREGDKKAPLGIFKLTRVFGYEKNIKTNMPYIQASKDLICVDDSDSKDYNRIIKMPSIKPKSFEIMRRDDDQYKLGIVVDHNKKQIKQAGSCIFLHVQKTQDSPTAGCTSMKYEDLKKIVEWLDPKKDPMLIQVDEKNLDNIKKLYPELPLD